MKKRRRARRGVSFGTVVMLSLTALVLAGFCTILPKLTGNTDVRIDASELAVAIDSSFSQIAAVSNAALKDRPATQGPQATILPPESLATAVPVTQPPKLSFTLCAAGSIKINSAVQKALTDEDGYRFNYLFEHLGNAMDADLSIATLENNVISTAKLTDANIPADVLASIRQAGVDALCLGYYGALDGGVEGLAETKRNIEAAGMKPYGVYASEAERNQHTVMNVNGLSVALLSYQNELSGTGKKKTTKEERAFAIASQQLPTIASDIAAAREAGAQVVVVSLCWGKVGATSPTNTQKELAQGIADAGADIILGTHTGALQTVQILTANRGDGKYHPVLCAYSLGNLFTYDRDKRVSLASILLNAEVVYDAVNDTVAFDNLSYTPTYSWRDKEDGKTRYRVLLNNGNYPEYVDKDQQNVMERCLKLVDEAMTDAPLSAKQ